MKYEMRIGRAPKLSHHELEVRDESPLTSPRGAAPGEESPSDAAECPRARRNN